MREPEIIINGIKCSNPQAMTLRVAIGSFIMSLNKEGLGDDETGLSIKDGYLKAANEIQHHMAKVDYKWTKVEDGLPEKNGDYFCLRYGMNYSPEIVTFSLGDVNFPEDDPPRFYDFLPHMNGGGGGVKLRKDMNQKEKHWSDNYGKVTHWFTNPERP